MGQCSNCSRKLVDDLCGHCLAVRVKNQDREIEELKIAARPADAEVAELFEDDSPPYIEPLDRPDFATINVNAQALMDLKAAILVARDIEELDPEESYAECVAIIGKCWQREIDRSERLGGKLHEEQAETARLGRAGKAAEEARDLVRHLAQGTLLPSSPSVATHIQVWDDIKASALGTFSALLPDGIVGLGERMVGEGTCGTCGARTLGLDGCQNCLQNKIDAAQIEIDRLRRATIEARGFARSLALMPYDAEKVAAIKIAAGKWDKLALDQDLVDEDARPETSETASERLAAVMDAAGIYDGKYTGWAKKLNADGIKAVLWAVGEFTMRGGARKNHEGLVVTLSHARQLAALDSLRQIYSHGRRPGTVPWQLEDVCANSIRAHALAAGEAPNCSEHDLPLMPKGRTPEEGYHPCRVCKANEAAKAEVAHKAIEQEITDLGVHESLVLVAVRWFVDDGASPRYHYYGIDRDNGQYVHLAQGTAVAAEAQRRYRTMLGDA